MNEAAQGRDRNTQGAAADHDAPLPRLSRGQLLLCLAVPVATFVFWTGPIWSHAWNIDAVDSAIWWSYLPLPILVLACLAWSRRLSLRAFLLDTLNLTLLKYGITFSIALVLWNVGGPPQKAPVLQTFGARAGPAEPPPPPTPIAPETTGTLQGVVSSADGRPVEGVLVFIEDGLEGYVFAPPDAPLRLENDGTGVTPRVSAAQTYQVISARSIDGHLHTLVAASAEGPLFNAPLLSTGAPTDVTVRSPHGVSRIRCAVHQGDTERPSYLAVFAHPFFSVTGPDGRFAWAGVPAGKLSVAAFHPEAGRATVAADLVRGSALELRLALPAGS